MVPHLIFLLPVVSAQIIPSTWINPKFGQSKDAIHKHTLNSFNSLLNTFSKDGDGGGWTAQNAWTSIAQFDHQGGTRGFYDKVKPAQDKLAADTKGGHWGIELVNDYNDDIGWAGMANVLAYETYGDDVFLDRAKGAYEFIRGHGYVSQDVLKDGYLKGTKNPDNKVQSQCNGKSMLGGVYWVNGGNNDPNDSLKAAAHAGINAVSTGNFALLGADLCRVTKDTTYCDRSYENVWWIERQLKNDKGMIYDGLEGTTCKITDWQFTYNQGLFFAAYAQLGFLTKNQTAIDIAKKAIKVALSSAAPWNSDNGIIGEGKGDVNQSDDGIGFKSIMIRYLVKVLPWINDEELGQAIKDYVAIQYYALTQLDSDSKENPVKYGRNWQGPYSVSTRRAQIAAMDVLNALAIVDDSQYAQSGSGPVMVLSEKARGENVVVPTSSKAASPSTSSRAQEENRPSSTRVSGQSRPSPVGGKDRDSGQPRQAHGAEASQKKSCGAKRQSGEKKN